MYFCVPGGKFEHSDWPETSHASLSDHVLLQLVDRIMSMKPVSRALVRKWWCGAIIFFAEFELLK